MDMDIKEFCFHLDQWKEDTGKKDIDFCRLIGIHPNTLVNWKKDKSAPQAKHMKKICEVFRINEVDLAPLSFYTANDNENKLYYRTQQLQRYAKSKGLDEEFYRQIVNQPYFLKEFPFSCVKDRFYQLKCPEYLAEDEEYRSALHSIPMSKYEFQDSYGHIIMLTEEDIDFLVKLQLKKEQLIRNELILEKHRKHEQKIRELINKIATEYVEDEKELSPGKLYDILTQTDFTVRVLTGSMIWDRFEDYCKTHNVKSKPFRENMRGAILKQHLPMTEAEREAWKQHYISGGMTEEEAEEQLKRRDDLRKRLLDIQLEVYKEEENNDGEH